MLSPSKRERLKKIGKVLLLISITLLTAKFFLLNKWRLGQFTRMTRGILKAPAAVNLVISNPTSGEVLYRKGFPSNRRGRYYFIYPFDITRFIQKTGGPSIQFSVNREPVHPTWIHTGDRCIVVRAGENFFVFSRPPGDIESFIRLRKDFPRLLDGIIKAIEGSGQKPPVPETPEKK